MSPRSGYPAPCLFASVTNRRTSSASRPPQEEALADTAYQSPETYTGTSDWLSHWSFSKGQRLDPPLPPEFIRKQYLEQ